MKTIYKNQIFIQLYNSRAQTSSSSSSSSHSVIPHYFSRSLRFQLNQLSKEDRREIVSRTTPHGRSPLFVACENGHVQIIDYLIQNCGADIEQRGLWSDNLTVTPLWVAVMMRKSIAVAHLIRYGANVNSEMKDGSTPLNIACFNNSFDIVTLLIKNGRANIDNASLVKSIDNTELCEYLITRGANVNERDIFDNDTVLHIAIREHKFETAKMLLERGGANPFIKNRYEEDALQTACVSANQKMFGYLINTENFSEKRITDGYELLRAAILNERTTDQQSLLIYRKKAHPHRYLLHVISHFDKYGEMYIKSGQFQNCIDWWLSSLELLLQQDVILCQLNLCFVNTLVQFYLDIDRVRFEDAFKTLSLLSTQIHKCNILLQQYPVSKHQQNVFDYALKVFLIMIYVVIESIPNNNNTSIFSLISPILKLKTFKEGNSLLHLALLKTDIIPFPLPRVFMVLLLAGGDAYIHVPNNEGHSPFVLANSNAETAKITAIYLKKHKHTTRTDDVNLVAAAED